MKVEHWTDMMGARGHKIIHLGTEGSLPPNAEQVDVLSDDIWQEVYGKVDYKHGFYEPKPEEKGYTVFAENAIREIKDRYQAGDIVISSLGRWQKPITDALKDIPGMVMCELGVGYEGSYLPHRVFESYAWMNHRYGVEIALNKKKGQTDNMHWFDAVIYMYFRPSDFIPASEILSVDEKEPYYFFIGRMIPRKGPNIPQQVVDELNRRGEKCKLIVAGQGDPWKVMDKSPNIEYVGVINPEERTKLMSRARATFVPSLYLEPFGAVVVESYMSGTPVISTDSGAFSETVLHGYTGYRCRTFDQFMWASRKWAELDPKAIRQHAEDNYGYDVIAPQYEEYFQALTDTVSPGGWYTQHPDRPHFDCLKRRWPNK